MTIRVVLADDDHLVRSGLALLLASEDDIEVVAEVSDGEQAIGAVERLRPDVAVLDLNMPGTDGVTATRVITGDSMTARLQNPVAVLALTNFHIGELTRAALKAGASGFLIKDASPAELAQAVREVAGGEAWLAPKVTRDLLADYLRRPDPVLGSVGAVGCLTEREREVLVLMAHGLSNAEIARHLVVVVGTIKTHVSRIFMKLGIRDRAQAVAIAYRSRLVGPEDPVPPAAGK